VKADAVDGGNSASTSTDNSVTFADVTVDQASTQVDPTAVSPIRSTVLFRRL